MIEGIGSRPIFPSQPGGNPDLVLMKQQTNDLIETLKTMKQLFLDGKLTEEDRKQLLSVADSDMASMNELSKKLPLSSDDKKLLDALSGSLWALGHNPIQYLQIDLVLSYADSFHDELQKM
jgi:hypothetical protein